MAEIGARRIGDVPCSDQSNGLNALARSSCRSTRAARGDITSFADRLAEDFELFVPGYVPWGGHYGRQEYIDLLPRVAAILDFTRLTYVSLTAEGEHVVALIKIGVRGTDHSIMISEHWDVAGDKAVRLRVAYFDPSILLDRLKAGASV